MKWRKVLSGMLALSMIAGSAASAAPMSVQAAGESQTAESNTASGYTDPWNSAAAAELESKVSPNVDSTKFTHQEWTGTTYTDVNGESAKAADVYEINREEASMFASTSVVYDTVEKAIDGAVNYNKAASKYVQFLTGEKQKDWSLVVLQNQTLAQGDAYKDFYKTSYTATTDDWKSGLELPCSWTRQGDWDFSIYTNTQMPWQSKYDSSVTVPAAPVNYNPVGLYRKTFDVSSDMLSADGRVYISFQGVESAYYVYVNGKEVGYSEDSYAPHSFDITDYLTADGTGNLLAVEVHKFCDGTWMEDQDMFYDGGIFRDVYLYSAPLVHIQDYTVRTDLDENYENAELYLSVDVANASTQEVSGYKVDAKLYDADGNVFVNGITLEPGTIAGAADGVDGKATAAGTKTVLSPELWSAETPYLYTLVLTLYDSNTGAYLGSVSQQLGFREIEFVSSQVDGNGNTTTQDSEYTPIKINGKQLLLKGTNRHDTDPVYGKYVPHETQEEDVKIMKQFNLNAIRTSHYSNDEYLYYLCDKYGLYMMAETNLESHALMNQGDNQKNFKNLAMDRTITTFERLKNRTAVVIWSTGNENYYSSSATYADGMFYDLVQYFKNNDPTRPVHSESSNKANGTDMGSNMYPSVGTVQSRANENMPYVLCEYAHAMGNAVGNLKEYWDAIRSSDNMLGAFVWDWVDQSRLLSLDTLPASYVVMEKKNNVKGSASITSVNDNPEDGALTGKSAVGYALFEDDSYNQALSGTGKAFTVEVICKPTTTRADQVLIAKGDRQFALKTNGNSQLEFFAYYNNSWNSKTVALPSDWLNNWHQVAATYDKGAIKIYCDGNLLVEGNGNTTIASSSTALGVGCSADNGRTFDGEISMGRVYTKVLTADELNAQNSTSPAIAADSEDVLLWADFSGLMVDESSKPYDYFAQTYAHQNLYKDEASGQYYCYGGDNGESPNDNSFCVNGLVSPDRDPQPELWEVKYQYQSVWFTATDVQLLSGNIKVYNENNFLNLNEFDVKWSLLEDGKEIGSGTVAAADIAGREKGSIAVPYLASMPKTKKAGAEYYLNLFVQLKEDTLWAKAGHEVAYEQFRIPAEVEQVTKTVSDGVTVDENAEDVVEVSGTDFSFQIDKTTGTLKNYTYKGETLLTTGPVPNYWRGLVNNDNGNYDGNWQGVNRNVTASDISVSENEDGQPVITVTLASASYASLVQTMQYTVDGSGAVTVTASVDATSTGLGRFIRIGTVMELPAGYEKVSWYGNGPVEAMWDREDFARAGVYNTTVSEMFYPYVDTQDTGTVTGVKWFTVTNPENASAMAIAAADTVEASALHFTVDDLTQAQHPYELTKLDETILTVNYRSQGTGNASCGQDTLSAYLLPNDKEYTYEYTMIPYVTEGADVTELTRPYRTVASVSEGDIIKAAAEELIQKIDGIVVTSEDTTELEALKTEYEELPEAGKELVTEERYQKIEDAIAFASKIDSNTKIIIEDKSSNGYDVDIYNEANATISSKDGIVALKGYMDVKGEGANETFNGLISGTNNFTIEAYINPNGYGVSGTDYNMIASKGDNSAAFRVSEQSVYFFIKNSSGSWKTCKSELTSEELNSWLHVAAIYNGNDISVYVEGKELVTAEGVGSVTASSYPLGIGYCPEEQRIGSNYIKNIRVYDKALTEDELDNGTITAEDAHVVLWYDFDEAPTYVLDEREKIVSPNITLTAPAAGETPAAAAVTPETGMAATTVWTDEDGEEVTEFEAGVDYTVTVTLTADEAHRFTDAVSKPVVKVGEETVQAQTEINDDFAAKTSVMTVSYSFADETKVGAKRALAAAIAEAEALTKDGYTEASWNAVQSALTEAKGVDTRTASAEAMQAAADKLTDAMNRLAKAITAPAVTFAAPVTGEYPETAAVTADADSAHHTDIADRAENPASLVKKDSASTAVIENQDGVWGFMDQLASTSDADKFDVYGATPMALSFRLYVKEAVTSDNPLNIIGKMDKQYGFQIENADDSERLLMYMSDGNNVWPEQSWYIEDSSFYGAWHDIVMLFDGTGKMRFYVDGEASEKTRETSDLTVVHYAKPFTIGYNPDKNDSTMFTSDNGYLADIRLYRGTDVTAGMTNDYAVIRNLLEAETPAANITAVPYDTKTTWSTGGEVLAGNARFAEGTAYTVTTVFTAHDGFKFDSSSLNLAKVTAGADGEAAGSVSEDGSTMTISVSYPATAETACECTLGEITLEDPEVVLEASEEAKTVELNPEVSVNGNCPIENHPNEVAWSYEVTENSDVAEIAADGTVTAKAVGTAVIKVTATLAKKGEETVSVEKSVTLTVTSKRAAEEDVTALESAVNDANALLEGEKEALYTADTVEALRNAIAAAQEVLDRKPAVSADEVAEAAGSVSSAVSGLKLKDTEIKDEDAEKKAAQAAMKAALASAKAIIDAGQGNYTDTTWTAFKKAYDAAVAGQANGTATAEQLKALTSTLAGAQAALVKAAETPVDPGVKPGDKVELKSGRYQVISTAKKTAKLVQAKNKKKAGIGVPANITIKGVKYKVVQVGPKAFKGFKNLKKITLSSNITTVGKQAFFGCKKLSSVVVKGTALKKIGAKAFKGTSKKMTVTFKSKKVTAKKRAALLKKMKKAGMSKSAKLK